ncbi:MAG TPA: histidinol-phosphate transaminase [Opitutus sp.]|nr:histidinol-phosphate transaminase [Opitutus sp.]
MSKFSEFVPERIRQLPPYVPGKPIKQAEAESGVTAIKLASNENPFGPSPLALHAMDDAARSVHLYPDNDATELKNRLAAHHGVGAEQVLVTGGSTPLLDIIARTVLAPGLNAITSERSFIVYPIVTRSAGAEFRKVPMKNDTFDLDAIAAAVDKNTRLIFLANPNNPTGTIVTAAELDRFLDKLPDHVLVALDEAYWDFAEWFARERKVEYSHSLDYVRQGRNVVVLRTFSKAQGLAAVRVGYGAGPADLMGYFARVRTAFMVSGVAQAAAMASLEDRAHYEKTMRNNAEQSRYLISALREMGCQPVETWSNFIYCEIGENASAVSQRLQQEGIIIRPMTGTWGAPTAIRVTIGTPAQNESFVKAMKKVVASATAAL